MKFANLSLYPGVETDRDCAAVVGVSAHPLQFAFVANMGGGSILEGLRPMRIVDPAQIFPFRTAPRVEPRMEVKTAMIRRL